MTFLIHRHQTDSEDILCVSVCDMLGLYLSFSAVVYYCIIMGLIVFWTSDCIREVKLSHTYFSNFMKTFVEN